ncbi:hypothetical protein D9M72_421180 [compost metagenome]
MDIAGIGHAPAAQPAFCIRDAPRPGHAPPPASRFGHGTQQGRGTFIRQVPQPEIHGIGTRLRGQLIDHALMRKRIGRRRYPAQPGRAHDRGRVVATDAARAIRVRWHGGAIAHLQRARRVGHGTGQHQRQRRRIIGRIAAGEVVAKQRAVRPQRGADVHQLGRALGFPQVFLLARELHAHGPPDRARQQCRVGAYIVGAVAPVAAGSLHAHDLDAVFAEPAQLCQIDAQHMRVLRAGPHRQAIVMPVGHGA